jgi:hypothetical protein
MLNTSKGATKPFQQIPAVSLCPPLTLLPLPSRLPAAPSYDTNYITSPTQQQPADWPAAAAAAAPLTAADRAWQGISIPPSLGLAAVRHKWRQNLSQVELFIQLPDSVTPKQVCVCVCVCVCVGGWGGGVRVVGEGEQQLARRGWWGFSRAGVCEGG